MSESATTVIDPSILRRASADAPEVSDEVCLEVKDLSLYYGESQALKNVS